MIVLQLVLYCLLFTAMVKYAVRGGAINGLYLPFPYAVCARHPGCENIPYVQTWPQMLKKRVILTLIWVAGIVMLIFR